MDTVCHSATSNMYATCSALWQLLHLEDNRMHTDCCFWPGTHLLLMYSTHKKNVHWISYIVGMLPYPSSSSGWMTFCWQYSLAWITTAVLHSNEIISTPRSEKHVPLTKLTTCSASILLKYSAHTSYCWSQSLVDTGPQVSEIWQSHNTKLYNFYLLLFFCGSV